MYTSEMAAKASCISCLGQEGPLSEAEMKLRITFKGFKTLIKSCKERKYEISERLLPLVEQFDETPEIHLNFKCRSTYTEWKKIALTVKRSKSSESTDEPKPKRLSREETSTFS